MSDQWWRLHSLSPELADLMMQMSAATRKGFARTLIDRALNATEGTLVKSVDVPGESSADSADLFCGNVGKSKTSQLEDCQVWGYWARYGQYLVYLELAGVNEPANAIREVIEAVDARVHRTDAGAL